MFYIKAKVRDQASIIKKSQNNHLPSSAFCSSEQQMSFHKTLFPHCFLVLRTVRIVFFWLDHNLGLVMKQDIDLESFAAGPQKCL